MPDRTPNELADVLDRLQNSYIAKMADGHNSIIVRTKDEELAECYRLMRKAAALLRRQGEQLDTLRAAIGARIVLPPGHTVEDRLAAIRSTPNGALVNIGKPSDSGGGWFKQYRRVDSRHHGVSQLGYFRDGDTADQDIRMTRTDEPWAIEVTHLPVDVVAAAVPQDPEGGRA